MCQFFSLVSDGKGKVFYFAWPERKKILAGELNYIADSHTSIADFNGFKGKKEDSLNKYEYNPLTKEFTVDQTNTTNDSIKVEKLCKKLNFKKIIPALIIKPIINPLKDKSCLRVSKADLRLLKKWDSVWDSVWDTVGDKVGNKVWDSVWDSVRDSVRVYVSSFFNIKFKFDFSCSTKLWNKGLVPSFDGKIWRLHGKGGKILKEITKEKLRNIK